MLLFEQSAFAPDVHPKIFGFALSALGASASHSVLTASAVVAHGSFVLDDFAAAIKHDVADRLAAEHRLHHRLSQVPGFRARRRVAPRFERMMRRQQQTRHRGGFVRHASRPHHERNFLQRLGDSRRRRHREDRISAREERHIDLAAAHRVHHRVNFVRRAGLFGRRVFEEHDRLAKIAGDRS